MRQSWRVGRSTLPTTQKPRASSHLASHERTSSAALTSITPCPPREAAAKAVAWKFRGGKPLRASHPSIVVPCSTSSSSSVGMEEVVVAAARWRSRVKESGVWRRACGCGGVDGLARCVCELLLWGRGFGVESNEGMVMGVWGCGRMGVRASSAVRRTAAISSGQRSLICDTTSGSCVLGG